MIDKKREEMIYQLPPKNFVIVPCDIDKKDHIHINIQGRFIVTEKKNRARTNVELSYFWFINVDQFIFRMG